jgi:hypothetical protein
MRQNRFSPEHSGRELPRLMSSNDNLGRPLQIKIAIGPTKPTAAAKPFIRRIWAPVMIALALGFTAAWISLLGYGLVILIMRTI